MTNDLLIYGKNICVFPHIRLCIRSHKNFLTYEENFVFFFFQSRARLIRISLSTFKMNRISCVIRDRLVEIQGTGLSLTLCPWTDHILGPYMRYTHLYIFIIFRYVTHKISLVWLALSIVSWSPHLHEYCCKEILRSHC